MPRRLRTAPQQGGFFEKSPLHPAKTFTLAAKAEGQVVDLPLAGVSVIRVTPSSPKRLYLPLRANLHRQVWGLDSVPAPYGEATSAFWSGGGVQGGTPCIAFQLPLCSGGGFARTMAKRQRGADGTSASRWRRSRRTGKMAAVKGLRVEISRREILPDP